MNSGQSLWKGSAEISSHWTFCPHLPEFGRHTHLDWVSVCLLRALVIFDMNQLPSQSTEDSSLGEEALHILLSNTYWFICYSVKDVLQGSDWEFSSMINWDLWLPESHQAQHLKLLPMADFMIQSWDQQETPNSQTSSECFISLDPLYQLACP